MKELEITQNTIIGIEPNETRSLTFRKLGTQQYYTINHIRNGDYLYFQKLFNSRADATGWKGFKMLEKKYKVIDSSPNSPEEEEQIKKGFDDFWKSIGKKSESDDK